MEVHKNKLSNWRLQDHAEVGLDSSAKWGSSRGGGIFTWERPWVHAPTQVLDSLDDGSPAVGRLGCGLVIAGGLAVLWKREQSIDSELTDSTG